MNPSVLSSQGNFLVTFLASFLIWFLLLGLFYLWIIDGKVKKEVVLHALVASIVSWTIVTMIKSLLPFPRPYEISQEMPLTFTLPENRTSFPSAHAAVAFALAISVWFHSKKIGLWFVVGAVFVSLGRVFSNVHFYADVVGGAIIGVGVSYLIKKIHTFKLLR